jgi:hypothetical protein
MSRTSKVDTPMLDRMRAVKADSQKIGSFIDWLNERGTPICEKVHDDRFGDEMVPVSDSIEKLLARYFEIDLVKVEDERRALLDEMRGSA